MNDVLLAPGESMNATLYRRHGGRDVLSHERTPRPAPGPGEALIAVGACALNHLDVLQRRGPALIPGFELPHIAGMDVAGTVIELGPDADLGPTPRFALGDRVVVNPAVPCGTCTICASGADGRCPTAAVIGGTIAGGYAEYVVVPLGNLYAIPDDVDFVEAACIPTIWMTAHHALNVTTTVVPGETVLIHAAGSGVSTAAIQLAKAAGARVIATVSAAAKVDYAYALGADSVVDTSTHDTVAAAREFTGGRGVDVVVDHVGPATFPAGIYSLAPRGRLVFFGNTTGNRVEFDLVYAYHFGLQLLGSDPYDTAEFGPMLDAYWGGDFRTPVDSEYPLADTAAAQERLESRRATGKIVVRP